MEATKEEIGFLDKIRPPRLEEAGLEDCALPPDSIKEAFLKAAAAVSSRVSSGEADGECVNDPLPGEDVGEASGPCAAEKGGALIEDGYRGPDLVGSGIPEAREDVIFPPPGEEKEGGDGRPCVDGVGGLTIGEKEVGGQEEEGEDPTLVEVYLV